MAKVDAIDTGQVYPKDTPQASIVDGAATVRGRAIGVLEGEDDQSVSSYIPENPFNKQLAEAKIIAFLELVDSNSERSKANALFQSDTQLQQDQLTELLADWLSKEFISREDVLRLDIPEDLCHLQTTYIRIILSNACSIAGLGRVTERDLVAAGQLK